MTTFEVPLKGKPDKTLKGKTDKTLKGKTDKTLKGKTDTHTKKARAILELKNNQVNNQQNY